MHQGVGRAVLLPAHNPLLPLPVSARSRCFLASLARDCITHRFWFLYLRFKCLGLWWREITLNPQIPPDYVVQADMTSPALKSSVLLKIVQSFSWLLGWGSEARGSIAHFSIWDYLSLISSFKHLPISSRLDFANKVVRRLTCFMKFPSKEAVFEFF